MNEDYNPERNEDNNYEMSDYTQEFLQETERISTLCKEAIAFGQTKRVKELMHEMYEVGHQNYEVILGEVKIAQELKERIPNEDMKKILDEFIENAKSLAKTNASVLNKFMEKSIDSCSEFRED